MSWWSNATQEQRLAQIDGGIECGMTSKQIAMCLGAPIYDDQGGHDAVFVYGRRNGRRFTTPTYVSAHRAGKRGGKVSGILRARAKGTPEIHVNTAFSIFDNGDEENPFATLTQEFEA